MKKIILILSFLCLSVSSLFAINLSDIRNQIRTNLKDLNTVSALEKYDDLYLNYLINEAHSDVIEYSWCVIKSTTIDLTADTTYYALPSDYYVDYRMIYDNDVIPRTSIELLDRDEGDSWLSASTGTPTNYYIDLERDNIGMYPVPSSAKATSIDFWYIAVPTLSSDTDVPFDGIYKFYPYHRMLVWYVMAEINAIEGLPNVDYWYTKYQAMLIRLKTTMNVSPNYVPSIGFDRDGYR